MKKIFTVAKWEFVEKVKTKAFVISLILTPAIIIFFSIAPTLLSGKESDAIKVIGFVDTSGIYFKPMEEKLAKYSIEKNQPAYILVNLAGNNRNNETDSLKKIADKDVLNGKVEGYILVNNGGTDSVSVEYRSKSIGNFKDAQRFSDAFNDARIERKLKAEGISPEIIEYISRNIELKPVKLEESGKEGSSDFLTTFFTAFIFIMLFFMMIMLSGQMLVRSLVEEKSNRLIEIIISSCSADELLTGKIFGLGALGLFQILIWASIAVSLLGASVIPYTAFQNILPMFIYFLLGSIFFTAIFVGIGSIVTTEQEAQQITTYLSFILLLPIVMILPLMENPHSILIKVLSYIPLTLPTTMILRLNITPVPFYIISITIVIMLISIYFAIKIASKIFRIGILSYGKRPSLKELGEWIRES
ncbi:MAG: ABC transporter permease [Ignavibacteriaceae bacterium]